MEALWALDGGLAGLCAGLAAEAPSLGVWLFRIADSLLAKSLLFAPWLLVAWSRGGPAARERVLAVPAACALALASTWVVTTLWQRPRPLHAASGLEAVASRFGPLAEANPSWLHWGCFPSDHAAYLCALGLGLYALDRRVGVAALAVGLGLCCGARMSVGLHYASDVAAGIAVGVVAHRAVARALRAFAATPFRRLRIAVETHAWLHLALAVVVVEMAVMFRDLRSLEALFFPLP